MPRPRASIIIAAFLLAPVCDAASFLGPRNTSLVGQASTHGKKEMPITRHDKDAGEGYNPGSPLYEEQQALKRQKASKHARKHTASPEEEPNYEIEGLEPGSNITEANNTEVFGMKLPEDTNDIEKLLKEYDLQEQHVGYGLSSFFSYLCTTLLIGLIWVKCIGREPSGYDLKKNLSDQFTYGLCSFDHCFGHNVHVCLCSLCCAPLRMADTYSKEPMPLIQSFWGALIFVTCLIGLSYLSFGITGLIFLIFAVYYRQQMRRQYGLQTGGSTCLMDFFIWWCCPCCAIAQEARQKEFVGRPGSNP